MTKLNPYITLPGTAAEAIELYKKVFKTEPATLSRFKDMPPQEGVQISPEAQSERTLRVQATTRSARAKLGILLEMSSDFFKQTPPKFIYRGSRLARRFAPRGGFVCAFVDNKTFARGWFMIY